MSDAGMMGSGSRLKQSVGLAALELAVVAVAWWFLKLDNLLAIAIGAAVVLSTLAPARVSGIVSGASLLGLSALTHFHYGQDRVALLLGVIGGVYLAIGITRVLAKRSG